MELKILENFRYNTFQNFETWSFDVLFDWFKKKFENIIRCHLFDSLFATMHSGGQYAISSQHALDVTQDSVFDRYARGGIHLLVVDGCLKYQNQNGTTRDYYVDVIQLSQTS